jgi:hypothetical protein
MEQLFRDKQKTHRSCFRKIFLHFVSKDEIGAKTAQNLIDEYPDLINACQGKYVILDC